MREAEGIVNLLVENQQALIEMQSFKQKLVSILYFIFQEQKQVAKTLNKTPSTVSIQYKKRK